MLSQPRIDNGARPARVLGYVQLDGIEAARGTRREVEVIDEDLCGACDGSGAAPGAEALVCATCAGRGTVRASAGIRLGRWLKVEPCPACEGEGRLRTPCPTCGGRGELRRERTIDAHIPSGVEDGTRLRLAGEDDAYLVVRVRPLPGDSSRLRLLALALLVCAVALLVYFVVWV